VNRVLLSPEAELDVDEIAFRIALDKPDAAKRWLSRAGEQFRMLADWPGAGPARAELRVGLRSLPFGNYVIFYRPTGDGVEIVRVLDGHRDLGRLF
jgi:toxin ParE1/3/4